jgi:uncharacterized protein (DUF2147 family)
MKRYPAITLFSYEGYCTARTVNRASAGRQAPPKGRRRAAKTYRTEIRMRAHLAALVIALVPLLLLRAGSAQPAPPTAVGLWQQINPVTGKPNAWFRVSEHDGIYSATIVKIFKQDKGKQNLLCTDCSGAQKDAPFLGLTIVNGMEREGLDYENGTILDPRDGSEYYGRMRLSPDGRRLTVRGYLGIDPLGGDKVWRRLPVSASRHRAAAVSGAPAATARHRATSPAPENSGSR